MRRRILESRRAGLRKQVRIEKVEGKKWRGLKGLEGYQFAYNITNPKLTDRSKNEDTLKNQGLDAW